MREREATAEYCRIYIKTCKNKLLNIALCRCFDCT